MDNSTIVKCMTFELLNIAELNNSLNFETYQLEQKQQLLEDVSTDQFIEDQAKENLGMKGEDEEVIIGS